MSRKRLQPLVLTLEREELIKKGMSALFVQTKCFYADRQEITKAVFRERNLLIFFR